MKLLHVQHENGIFQDAELTSCVQRLYRSDIPVVVTEHAVDGRIRAWERDATALVALTRSGADTLRARWPNKRVEHIPHGCPVWFPPRKSTRGKVIGAFGFLQRHKGFWQLLEALPEIAGSELVMFSTAKSADTEREFEEAARGLPVRRIREYLPAADIARSLAAEADILVFWYDPVGYSVASGAVRIGLATGVPVLTSKTGWFHGLGEAIYQPSSLVEGIRNLMEDTSLRQRTVEAAHSYCQQNNWTTVAQQHLALWQSLANRD